MSYRDLFSRLNAEGVDYVVPRKYDELPEDTVDEGGDVDIIVDSSQFQTGIDVCEAVGFSSNESIAGNRTRLFVRAIRNPLRGIRVMRQKPRKLFRTVVTGDRMSDGNPRHANRKLFRGSQMVDIRNNLAYRSPMDESRIPVHPSVTEGMLERRRKRDCFHVPAPCDELAHVVTHCVFDKDGEFSSYYAARCNALLASVRSDDRQYRLFEDLLGRIFFDADDHVHDLLVDERYDDIRPELRGFSDY